MMKHLFPVLSLFVLCAAQAEPFKAVRPADWTAHLLPMRDTREKPSKKVSKPDCELEVIELAYNSEKPKQGTILLIPGFFQNAFLFDLMPEQGTSFARYLMREKGLKVYMLNPRGTGRSCYPTHSRIDDVAIDDLPSAVEFVSQRENERIFVGAHSQGGIGLQAAMAGLTRCDDGKNCFKAELATERQRPIRGVLSMAVNAKMSAPEGDDRLSARTRVLYYTVLLPNTYFLDRIPASWLTRFLSPTSDTKVPNGSIAYKDSLWDFAYKSGNISPEQQKAFYDLTLDSSSVGIIKQTYRGIHKDGIENTAGEKYADALSTVKVPVAQAAFDADLFANSEMSRLDNFDRLGSEQKIFQSFESQGHEDFLLNGNYHAQMSGLVDFLLAQPQ